VREEGEEPRLTVSQVADLIGVSRAELRERLDSADRANGGRPGLPRGRAQLELASPAEVAARTESHQPGQSANLTLDLVARLEAQATEISRLTAIANKAESLAGAFSAEREEREAIEAELEEARSELRSLKSHLAGLHARHHHRLGLETELVRTQAELAAAKAQLAEAQTTWRDLVSPKLKFRVSRREQRDEAEKERRVALEAELAEARGGLQRAQRRIAELEAREAARASLGQRLAVAQRELREAQAQIRELPRRRRRRALSLVAQHLGRG
jgi:chromosome segregation ATPase